MLPINIANDILFHFQVDNAVTSITILQEMVKGEQKRLIYQIGTACGRYWVCRLTSEENYPPNIIEQQSQFAMLLWHHGILTPKKMKNGKNYCIEIEWDNQSYYATLEEYAGADIEEVNLDTFGILGKLIGQMHAISEKYPIKIDFSSVRDVIHNGRAKFDRIVKQADLPQTCYDAIRRCAVIHDELINELRMLWNELPYGAVHGDIGICNNLVHMGSGIGIIDFNLAGTEAFLGDMLVTFYASIYKYSWQGKLAHISRDQAFQYFLKEYLTERSFTTVEKLVYSRATALFDGLFFSKAVVEEWNKTRDIDVLARLDEAVFHFNIENHIRIVN